jgi:transcriptional regulator with XRE-family HTH domain
VARQNFRRRSGATTPEARFEASRIQDARRRGYTNREIAQQFGINERTVRKIVSGETSGRRIYREKIAPARRETGSPSIVRLDLVVGIDDQGNEIIRTVNAKTPLINGRTPTPFDAFRLPDLATVARNETARLLRQYAGSLGGTPIDRPRISSIRPIMYRDPRKRLVTIVGRAAMLS